jgi:hypothetical protein
MNWLLAVKKGELLWSNHSIANRRGLLQLVSGRRRAEDCLCKWRGAELKQLGMDGKGGVALSPSGFEGA